MSLAQQRAASGRLSQQSCGGFRFFGGYDGAERKRLAVFPEGLDLAPETAALFVKNPGFGALSHRDYLGAILALGIERCVVGDIAVGDGGAYVFVMPEKADFIAGELTKIGSSGVKCERVFDLSGMPERSFEEKRGVVSGMRLDAVAAEMFSLPRGKAQALVDGAKVFLNGEAETDRAKEVADGDVISCRGYGKAVVASKGSVTKKGRLSFSFKIYK